MDCIVNINTGIHTQSRKSAAMSMVKSMNSRMSCGTLEDVLVELLLLKLHQQRRFANGKSLLVSSVVNEGADHLLQSLLKHIMSQLHVTDCFLGWRAHEESFATACG